MVFTLILSIIALAALYQLAKVIFFAICWLGCELLWLALYLCGAIFAPPVAPVTFRPQRHSIPEKEIFVCQWSKTTTHSLRPSIRTSGPSARSCRRISCPITISYIPVAAEGNPAREKAAFAALEKRDQMAIERALFGKLRTNDPDCD